MSQRNAEYNSYHNQLRRDELLDDDDYRYQKQYRSEMMINGNDEFNDHLIQMNTNNYNYKFHFNGDNDNDQFNTFGQYEERTNIAKSLRRDDRKSPVSPIRNYQRNEGTGYVTQDIYASSMGYTSFYIYKKH